MEVCLGNISSSRLFIFRILTRSLYNSALVALLKEEHGIKTNEAKLREIANEWVQSVMLKDNEVAREVKHWIDKKSGRSKDSYLLFSRQPAFVGDALTLCALGTCLKVRCTLILTTEGTMENWLVPVGTRDKHCISVVLGYDCNSNFYALTKEKEREIWKELMAKKRMYVSTEKKKSAKVMDALKDAISRKESPDQIWHYREVEIVENKLRWKKKNPKKGSDPFSSVALNKKTVASTAALEDAGVTYRYRFDVTYEDRGIKKRVAFATKEHHSREQWVKKINRRSQRSGCTEEDWKSVRQKHCAESLKKFGVGALDIGIAFSGGGARAMLSTALFINAMTECKLLNMVLYVSGLSGSSWCLAPWMCMSENPFCKRKGLGDPWSGTSEMCETASEVVWEGLENALTKGSKWELAKVLFRYLSEGNMFSSWAVFLSNMVIQSSECEYFVDAKQKLSPFYPIPIMSGITHGMRSNEKQWDWVEFTPFAIEVYEECKRERNSYSQSDWMDNDLKLHELLSVWGSAWAADWYHHLQGRIPSLVVENFLDVEYSPEALEGIKSFTKSLPQIPFGKTLHEQPVWRQVRDAGIKFNLALPPLLNRQMDVIICVEASEGADGCSFLRQSVQENMLTIHSLDEHNLYEPFPMDESCGSPYRLFRPKFKNDPYIIVFRGLVHQATTKFEYSSDEVKQNDRFIQNMVQQTKESLINDLKHITRVKQHPDLSASVRQHPESEAEKQQIQALHTYYQTRYKWIGSVVEEATHAKTTKFEDGLVPFFKLHVVSREKYFPEVLETRSASEMFDKLSGCCILQSSAGEGKSTFCRFMARSTQSRRVVLVDLESLSKSPLLSKQNLVEVTAQLIADHLWSQRDVGMAEELKETFDVAVTKHVEDVFWVFDSLDKAETSTNPSMRIFLERLRKGNVRWIIDYLISCRVERTSKIEINTSTIIQLAKWEAQQWKDFFVKRLKFAPHKVRIFEEVWTWNTVFQQLLQVPLFCEYSCEFLEDKMGVDIVELICNVCDQLIGSAAKRSNMAFSELKSKLCKLALSGLFGKNSPSAQSSAANVSSMSSMSSKNSASSESSTRPKITSSFRIDDVVEDREAFRSGLLCLTNNKEPKKCRFSFRFFGYLLAAEVAPLEYFFEDTMDKTSQEDGELFRLLFSHALKSRHIEKQEAMEFLNDYFSKQWNNIKTHKTEIKKSLKIGTEELLLKHRMVFWQRRLNLEQLCFLAKRLNLQSHLVYLFGQNCSSPLSGTPSYVTSLFVEPSSRRDCRLILRWCLEQGNHDYMKRAIEASTPELHGLLIAHVGVKDYSYLK